MTITATEYLGAEKTAEIERRFGELLPKKRLLALQLDGFSHGIVYDDVPRGACAHRIDVSFCMSPEEEIAYAEAIGQTAESQKAARAFLADIGYGGHASFQGRAVEIRFVEPEDR